MQGKYFFLSYNLLLPLIRARPKVLVMGVACRAAFRRFFLRGRGCGFRGFPELIRKKGRGYQVLLYYFFFFGCTAFITRLAISVAERWSVDLGTTNYLFGRAIVFLSGW